ncbi:hypothetical protein ACYATO_06635 [Lactobacillaceae bacterium Melli_B3]
MKNKLIIREITATQAAICIRATIKLVNGPAIVSKTIQMIPIIIVNIFDLDDIQIHLFN